MRECLVLVKRMFLVSCLTVCYCYLSAQNPIITDVFTADPAAMVYDGTVYLYTGHDEAGEGVNSYRMNDWQCFSTTDMTNWTSHGEVFNVGNVSWASGDAWAGEVEERNGKFYFYFCAEHRSIRGKAVGVAVADSPFGPFTDIGSPLITNDMTDFDSNWDDIDPTVFIDDDGQAYMYWGNSQCYYIKLNENMTETEGSIVKVNLPLFTEAPYIHKKDGTYYLSYAYGWPEQIAYATSNSITGPWTFRSVINEEIDGCGTNHQSIIEFNGKDYFIYHNAGLPTGGDYRRSVCVEYLYYNADGTIKPIVQTTEGVSEPSTTTFNNDMPWNQLHTWHGGHDPTFIRDENGTYSLLMTNNMLRVQQSTDMLNYSGFTRVFNSLPAWVGSEGIGAEDVWAPQITHRDGKYWCYYSVSTFGSRNSAIGLAVTNTLDVNSPDYQWEEKGVVVRSTTANNYNAIDADVITDSDGTLWMVFGSWNSGIKMIELDPATGMQSSTNKTIYSLAAKGGGIEGPSIIEHDGEYFLFNAWDACCDGTNSTYKTAVGKASSMTGTFRDRSGTSLMDAGGTILLRQYGRYYGPGGGSAVKIDNRYYFIHHFYDANRNGAPGLQTREMVFDDENWPHITQPFLGRRMSFEAEHAELINCEFTEGDGEISGGEYVGYINYDDSRVIFHVNALQAGEYKLIVHYAAGGGGASHTVEVNSSQTALAYRGTAAWGSFPEGQFAELDVTLEEGYNRIAFSPGNGFAELDRIDLVKYADQAIEAGTFDGSNSPQFDESTNSIVLENGKWAQYENIHFGSGGYTNAVLKFNGACNGTVTVALNDVDGNIQASGQVATAGGQETFALNTDFQEVTGIYDVYVSSTGTCALDDFQFTKSVVMDCNGDEGGSAYTDGCGTCVGGNTGLMPCADLEDGFYTISSFTNELCISSADGVSQNACSASSQEQIWRIESNGSSYTIYSPTESAELSVASASNGADLGFGLAETEFSIEDMGDGTYTISLAGNEGFVLDVPNCAATEGLEMNLWSRLSNDCQKFVISPAESQYDCNSEWGGTAYLDDCSICVGGSTGLEPCSAIQLEEACEYAGSIDSNNEGYAGTGFVNIENAIGAAMSIKLNATTTGKEAVSIRYANGVAENRPVQVLVNGEEIEASLDFSTTGSWDNWETVDVLLPLLQGVNELRVVSLTGAGAANFDQLIVPSTITLASCNATIAVSDSVQLNAGWNIIGFPHIESESVTVGMSSILPYLKTVKNLNSFWSVQLPDYLNSLHQLEWGKGYYVYVTENCVLKW